MEELTPQATPPLFYGESGYMNMYKWMCMILLAGMLIWSGVSTAAKPIGTFSFILGGPKDVTVKAKGGTTWSPAKLGLAVNDGDLIKTLKESRCEIKLADKSIIRIGEETEFEFTSASITSQQRNVKGDLKDGQIYLNLNAKTSSKSQFQIKAPTAVCAVRGTIYRVDADSTTNCRVYDGIVDVGPTSLWGQPIKREGKSLQPYQVPGPSRVPGPYEVSLDQWVQIVKGFQITVRKDGKFDKSPFDAQKDATDDWVKWNKQRDEMVK
jgi:hypothetical protein